MVSGTRVFGLNPVPDYPTMALAISLNASISRQAGGMFLSVRRLCQAMASLNVHVEAFGLNDKFFDEDSPHWAGVSTRVFHSLGPQSIGYSPRMRRMLIASDATIVHQHGLWMYPSVACMQWAKRTARPYLISPRGMLDPWALANSRRKKLLAGWLFQNAHLKKAACINALCESEGKSIRSYGLRNPLCVIPNGVDLPEQKSKQVPPWSEQVEADRRVLLFLGRIHPKKGLRQLLKGWAEAKQLNAAMPENWTLVIAGWDQGGYENELKHQARELGLSDSVVFVGPLFNKHKSAALESANAFVLPSFSEGLPMAVLEAWAYGLPVIMTPYCNLSEGVEAKAAITIEPRANEIAQGLALLWEMTDRERSDMGAKGKALVEKHYSWPKVAADMLSVYQWILGGGIRPACVITD